MKRLLSFSIHISLWELQRMRKFILQKLPRNLLLLWLVWLFGLLLCLIITNNPRLSSQSLDFLKLKWESSKKLKLTYPMLKLNSKVYKISKLDLERHLRMPWQRKLDFLNQLPRQGRRWTKLIDLLTPFKQIKLDGFKMLTNSNLLNWDLLVMLLKLALSSLIADHSTLNSDLNY